MESRLHRLLIALSLGLLLLASGPAGTAAAGPAPVWETWTAQQYSLQPRESFQFRIPYEEIPVRRWKLMVDGAGRNCDLSVLRVNGESLLYYKTDETRHEVSIPWGSGEEIIAVLTNRHHEAVFTVTLLGPPRDQLPASYSYDVNRALENFGSGQRLQAEQDCRSALVKDPDDAVAKVLLAGFRKDADAYDEAAALVEEALGQDLPPEMEQLAQAMRAELVRLRAPLPKPVRKGVNKAEEHLAAGRGRQALEVCEKLLDGSLELDAVSRGRLLTLQGRALEQLGEDFAAVDAFTRALSLSRAKADQAVIYFHMGNLFLKMDNLTQAQGAFTIALQEGLPGALDLQARETLAAVSERLRNQR